MTADDTPQPKVMWRTLPVCSRCWMDRNFDRLPARVIDAPVADCIACEEKTDEGIFVRVKVEWP